MEWAKLFYILGAIALVGIVIWSIRSNPALYSAKNINRSFFTMGVLALILIVFVSLLVFWLKHNGT